MIIFPRAAYAQSLSPMTKDITLQPGVTGVRLTAAYLAETNAASTLDIKLQYHVNDNTWSDLLTPAEAAVDFVQFTGVANQTLVIAASGAAEELTTAPTLKAVTHVPRQIRYVATMAGGAGSDTITFSLMQEELYG